MHKSFRPNLWHVYTRRKKSISTQHKSERGVEFVFRALPKNQSLNVFAKRQKIDVSMQLHVGCIGSIELPLRASSNTYCFRL